MNNMLSIGMPSTLGSYQKICLLFFGDGSPQVRLINNKIAQYGADEEVIADESQMMYLLMAMTDEGSHELEDLLS